jgi:hypothetical protein
VDCLKVLLPEYDYLFLFDHSCEQRSLPFPLCFSFLSRGVTQREVGLKMRTRVECMRIKSVVL